MSVADIYLVGGPADGHEFALIAEKIPARLHMAHFNVIGWMLVTEEWHPHEIYDATPSTGSERTFYRYVGAEPPVCA